VPAARRARAGEGGAGAARRLNFPNARRPRARAPSPRPQTLHTLVRQAHLAPLPLSVQPVYWEHDYALRLLPLPDVLVLAEARDPVALEDSGLKMLCPGSFARETHFLYYSPALRTGDTHCRVEEAAPAPAQRATPATPRAL